MFEQILNEVLRESKSYEELEEHIDYVKELMSGIEDEMVEENNWYED